MSFQKFEDQINSWRKWQLLNVSLVLSEEEIDGPGLQRVYEEGGVRAYRVSDPFPRAWVVAGTVVATDEQAVDLLNAEEFDPRSTAVLPPEGRELALQSPRPDVGSKESNRCWQRRFRRQHRASCRCWCLRPRMVYSSSASHSILDGVLKSMGNRCRSIAWISCYRVSQSRLAATELRWGTTFPCSPDCSPVWRSESVSSY